MTTTARTLLSFVACSLALGRAARAGALEPAPAPAPAVAAAEATPAVPAAAPAPKTLSFGVGVRIGGGLDSSTGTITSGDRLGIKSLDVRPYISGQVHPLLKFEGNLDLNNADQSRIHVLSAVAKFEPDDLFNVWFGRFLPPSDRANLSGPYYQNAWNYPTDVNGYPSIYAGRADGGAVWGQLEKGRFKYQGGVFTLDANTPTSQALYAARLVLNLLDPEPGYYNSSTYYGTKDVLALGGAAQYQKLGAATVIGTDAAGAPILARNDLIAFNLDLLFEKRLAWADTLTVEGAYYNFNRGAQGWSWYALASYLFAAKVAFGQVQPMVRWQQFTPTAGGDPIRTLDTGFNYVIDGHSTRIAFAVQNRNPPTAPSTTSYQLGIQIQE
ncbi:MAG TPA: hypothetical protein VEQ15_06855 [Myxococcales bacterium]|nr:hypothetical protein [Myxococcales bacterium]